MFDMPVLETSRLYIRPFTTDDLEATAGFWEYPETEREELLAWSQAENKLLARLYQPPYGDRAVVLKDTSRLIGAAGLAAGGRRAEKPSLSRRVESAITE
jgi:ribosomal-protein-alanine N-acetyltransferase